MRYFLRFYGICIFRSHTDFTALPYNIFQQHRFRTLLSIRRVRIHSFCRSGFILSTHRSFFGQRLNSAASQFFYVELGLFFCLAESGHLCHLCNSDEFCSTIILFQLVNFHTVLNISALQAVLRNCSSTTFRLCPLLLKFCCAWSVFLQGQEFYFGDFMSFISF